MSEKQATRRHHYLPATFLASFSLEKTSPRRRRRIAVGDKAEGRCFEATAASVGLIKDFYTIREHDDPALIDDTWSRIEASLAACLDALIAGTIDALAWAGTLVPFVASLLVRGPDFNQRFEQRLARLVEGGLSVSQDNTNLARTMEMQRLLAPILAAHWIVAGVQGAGSLITNDVGFAGFRAPQVGALGIAIPMGHRHVLQLIPSMSRDIAVARGSKWLPVIQYRNLGPGNHLQLNEVLAAEARRFIFGPHLATVERFLSVSSGKGSKVPEPAMMGFADGPLARRNEFAWHWLVSILSKPVKDAAAWSAIDWEAVASKWKGVVVFPLNVPMGMPALAKVGDTIFIDLQAASETKEDE